MTASHFADRWSTELADAIGNTPLIRLRCVSEATGCTILGKAELIAVAWLPRAKFVHYYFL
jgi:hypothetical protein